MPVSYPFKKERSSLFEWVYRPYAIVSFWLLQKKRWLDVAMIVDSGADYTLLPKFYLIEFGLSVGSDTKKLSTNGIGGTTSVYLLRDRQRIKLGAWERNIPLGFVDNNDVPPLLGRQEFMETFKVTFQNHSTEFDV